MIISRLIKLSLLTVLSTIFFMLKIKKANRTRWNNVLLQQDTLKLYPISIGASYPIEHKIEYPLGTAALNN